MATPTITLKYLPMNDGKRADYYKRNGYPERVVLSVWTKWAGQVNPYGQGPKPDAMVWFTVEDGSLPFAEDLGPMPDSAPLFTSKGWRMLETAVEAALPQCPRSVLTAALSPTAFWVVNGIPATGAEE